MARTTVTDWTVTKQRTGDDGAETERRCRINVDSESFGAMNVHGLLDFADAVRAARLRPGTALRPEIQEGRLVRLSVEEERRVDDAEPDETPAYDGRAIGTRHGAVTG